MDFNVDVNKLDGVFLCVCGRFDAYGAVFALVNQFETFDTHTFKHSYTHILMEPKRFIYKCHVILVSVEQYHTACGILDTPYIFKP